MISDRRVIAGVVLLVAAAVVGLALWPDRHDPRVYEAEGGFAVGTITAVDGGRVEVRYRLRGEERHASAYPELGGPYAEGRVVELRALADRPDRVVIAGTEVAPRTADTLWWLAAVLGLTVGGLALVAWGVYANWNPSGDVPKHRWIGERHGA